MPKLRRGLRENLSKLTAKLKGFNLQSHKKNKSKFKIAEVLILLINSYHLPKKINNQQVEIMEAASTL